MAEMNMWLIAATGMLLGMLPAGVACLRGSAMARFVALQAAQTMAVLVLLLLAAGYGRAIYYDMALTLAVLTFASGLIFARFLERWL